MKSVLFLGLLLVFAGSAVEAQEISVNSTPIAELLERFVAAGVEAWDNGTEPISAIQIILSSHPRPRNEQEALIDGLADIVRNGPTPFVRAIAVSTLAFADSEGAVMPIRRVGPLLIQLFLEATTPGLRIAVINSLLILENPAVGLGLIRRVLTEEPPSFAILMEPHAAVMVATASGPPGHALLRELHQSGTIRNSGVRAKVAEDIAAGRLSGAPTQQYPDGLYAQIFTPKGVIVLELAYERVPMTVANFVGLAEGTIENDAFPLGTPFFDGSLFDRVVDGHVIQGGLANSEAARTAGYQIPNEIREGFTHGQAGALGMANGGPHTAGNVFYITLGDRSYLDGDYTVFGEVHSGMDVVMNIELNDPMDSVRIVRAGPDAEEFRPTTASFREMAAVVQERVRVAEEEKARDEAEHLLSNWPDAQSGNTDGEDGAGWRYVILEEGVGTPPQTGERISVRYTGRAPGPSFASTAEDCGPSWARPLPERGETCEYVVGESSVTPGLDAAIARMKPGARWIVIVPSELGYGTSGTYPPARRREARFHISPNTLLVYTVEVVGR